MLIRLTRSFLNQIPMTRVKLFVARLLYHLLHAILRKDHHFICRSGIHYKVDLSEGIDLSLYLFGNFQSHVASRRYVALKDDAIVLDIGANVGSTVLRFAQLAPHGHVYAFEPTDYAFQKLLINLSLNPWLANRITPVQLFLSDETRADHHLEAYSSWKVDGRSSNIHPLHGGMLKPAESVQAVTLNDYCLEHEIQRIDLIKIDTDGHEFQVLAGAKKILAECLPYIIFEISLYGLKEQKIEFQQYHSYFTHFNYTLLNAKNGRKINLQNFNSQIPARTTTDIIAVPSQDSI